MNERNKRECEGVFSKDGKLKCRFILADCRVGTGEIEKPDVKCQAFREMHNRIYHPTTAIKNSQRFTDETDDRIRDTSEI
jgi:hypothetical protein